MTRSRPSRLALATLPLVALAACQDRAPTAAPDLDPSARPALSVAPLSATELANPNGIIVALKALAPDGGIPASVRKAIADQGATVLSFDPASRIVVVAGLQSEKPIADLAETELLAPNAEASLHTDQSGAGLYASHQQNLVHVRANQAWLNPALNGTGARVCIIDSGVDDTHADLVGRVLADTNLVNAQLPRADGNAHGTHVGSTVSANGIGMASVAPGSRLLNARVFDNGGGGATTARIAAAIRWCGRQGAHVINMSLGFTGGLPFASPDIAILQTAIAEVRSGSNPVGAGTGGSVVVASAGNETMRIPSSFRRWVPAELDGVIAVGSTLRSADVRSSFTNRGRSVDIYAPGSAILAACSTFSSCGGAPVISHMGNRYMQFNGTSMAAPHVAGTAAIVYGAYGNTRSPANEAKVVSCLLGRALVNAVQQLPDPAGRRLDVLAAQTGRGAGSAACPS